MERLGRLALGTWRRPSLKMELRKKHMPSEWGRAGMWRRGATLQPVLEQTVQCQKSFCVLGSRQCIVRKGT